MKTNRLMLFAAVALGAIAFSPVLADDEKHGDQNRDHAFVRKAAQGSMGEVWVGQMAAERGENTDIKDFGRRMIADHSRALDELRQLASSEGIELPREVRGKPRHAVNRMSHLYGLNFDMAYAERMVEEHQKEIRKFEDASQHCQDPEIKAWAAKMLPTLREHLQMAERLKTTTYLRSNREGGNRGLEM